MPYFTDGETEARRVSTLLASPHAESARAGLEPRESGTKIRPSSQLSKRAHANFETFKQYFRCLTRRLSYLVTLTENKLDQDAISFQLKYILLLSSFTVTGVCEKCELREVTH